MPKKEINFSKLFIPPQFTPLYHTNVYAKLKPEQVLYYNQLYACFAHEQIMFFELTLGKFMPEALLKDTRLPKNIMDGLLNLQREESQHAGMFKKINQIAFPHIYNKKPYHFIKTSPLLHKFTVWQTKHPLLLPALLWIGLLLEERALHMAQGYMKMEDELDPYFFAVTKNHSQDELNHVAFGTQLFEYTWENSYPWMRRLNTYYFSWLISEYFCAPKRGAIAVVKELYNKFSDMPVSFEQMKIELLGLGNNDEYLLSCYSRKIVPKTFAMYDSKKEFKILSKFLIGYTLNTKKQNENE